MSLHPTVVLFSVGAALLYGFVDELAALRGLLVVSVVRILNPTLVVFPEATSVAVWMAILVLSMRILVSLRAQDLPHVAMLILYTLSVAALSLVSSANAAISLLKLLSFFLTSAAALVGFRHLSDMQRLGFVNSLVGVWIAAALLSLPTLAHSDIGFATNGEGFQGIFNHPQVLGVFFVPAVLFFIMQTLTHGRRLNLSVVGAVLCGSLMALSLSRTAALACLLALVMTAAAAAIMPSTPSLRARMRLFMPLSLAASVVVIVIMGSPEVREEVDEFLFKGDRNLSGGVEAAFYKSRGQGVEVMWENFMDSPLVGHGFQVYRSGKFPAGVRTVWGVPISASVEKGVVFVAVLEETGIIGGVFFSALVGYLFWRAARTRDPCLLALFFSALTINIGESVFFSAGGLGLYFWLLIGLSAFSANELAGPSDDVSAGK